MMTIPDWELSALSDGDLRQTQQSVHDTAHSTAIPHPIDGVQYADGVARVRHLTYPTDHTDMVGKRFEHPGSFETFMVTKADFDGERTRLTLVAHAEG